MEEFQMKVYTPPTTKIPFRSDKKYHVFLSFRGKDVRHSLIDRLFEALTAAGLHVFLDSEKLEKGEIIGFSLELAIESSVIRIPVFSRGYADSAWCLREAAAMLGSSGLIIPLFYDVNPTQVRYPQGNSSPFKRAFQKYYSRSDQIQSGEIEWWKYALQQICPCLRIYGHSARYPRKEIDGWKDALKQICARSGWSMDSTGGFEAQLVKTVVNDVIKTLARVPLEVAKHPVGMESITKELICKFNLNSGEDTVRFGILGIGGSGKTTLAKALYNQAYAHFDAASFVFNVRATAAADPTSLTKLQRKILKDLCMYGGKVNSVDEGISLFRDRLGQKSVLLILDDVDAIEQLNALAGDWLASGSRVIITSRNSHILHLAGISNECIHEMTELQINEGLQLFSWHAFLRASPNTTNADMSNRIVEACKGHPLSLEVIGAFLYDKQNDPGCWLEAFHNITLHPEIHERLKISYSALSEEEKEIFLDIACFFIGEHKTYPIVFWKSLYKMVHTAISNLSLKLLIKTDEEGVFDMHDHLRDMGRAIAEKEGTRLWDAIQLSRGLSNNISFSHVQLNGGNLQSLETLCRPGLQFLHLKNLLIDGIAEDRPTMLPSSLIWLRLEKCRFALDRPFHFSLVGNILQLRLMQVHLNISNFFQYSLSDILRNMPQLQHLDLSECSSLTSLPATIGKLSQLLHLNLRLCTKLNSISEAIGKLSQLQHLDLSGCISLNNLPNAIGNLSELQHLDLSGCDYLSNLPDTIGNLSKLHHLDLSGCELLKSLTDNFGNLSQLRQLDMSGCIYLNNLPDTIGNLTELQKLDLSGCEYLNNLCDTIGNLSKLQHLDLISCTKLTSLPHTIGNLLQLQILDLSSCTNLNKLPHTIGNVSQLQHLNLKRCTKLNHLPDIIGNLSQLQHFNLSICRKLNNIPDTIGNLSQLQHLDLSRCEYLKTLPDTIGNLSQLPHLNLTWCTNLRSLPDTIGNLTLLQHLDLNQCRNLNNLPDSIGNLPQLQHLDLRGCIKLNNLPDTIGNLSKLQLLDLIGCTKLNNLPNTIGNLLQLQYLNLTWCTNLNSIPSTIGNLSQLQHLNLSYCEELNEVPDSIGNLSQLRHLDLGWCTKLTNLPYTIRNLPCCNYSMEGVQIEIRNALSSSI